MAAQMLAGKGFNNIINLSGGIKGWNGEAAFGGEDLGLDLFSENEPPEQTLAVAYSLEAGLRDFYLSMIEKVSSDAVKGLFRKLSEIELKHQDRIFNEYTSLAPAPLGREEFEKTAVSEAVEGGMTTDEYVRRFHPNWETAQDVVGLAMTIEAQALDLYTRAADRSANDAGKIALLGIADEEKAHLKQLGELMNQIASPDTGG